MKKYLLIILAAIFLSLAVVITAKAVDPLMKCVNVAGGVTGCTHEWVDHFTTVFAQHYTPVVTTWWNTYTEVVTDPKNIPTHFKSRNFSVRFKQGYNRTWRAELWLGHNLTSWTQKLLTVACGYGKDVTCILPDYTGYFVVDPAWTNADVRWKFICVGCSALAPFEIWVNGAMDFWFEEVDCSEQFELLGEQVEIEIDPVLEFPGGAPEDEQMVPLVIDQIYALQLSGGPWMDPATGRYDSAYSWDGITYYPLEYLAANALCLDVDPTHPDLMTIYFAATGTTFYIRVDDLAGQFADNTVGAPYYYSMTAAMEAADETCAGQFDYDPEADLVAEGDINAQYSEGIIDIVPPTITVDEWYLLVTSPGPWYENGAPRTDIEIKNISGAWQDLMLFENVFCASFDEDYISVYFQADEAHSLIDLRVNDQDGNFLNNSGSIHYALYHVTYDRFLETCEAPFELQALVDAREFNSSQENGIQVDLSVLPPDVDVMGGVDLRPMQAIAVDTTKGPWYDALGLRSSYDTQYYDDPNQWNRFDVYPEASCVVKLDAHHYRMYYHATVGEMYRIRVDDNEFGDNSGRNMGYELRTAADLQIYEPCDALVEHNCDTHYSHEEGPLFSTSIQATAEGGIFLPAMTANEIYAIETIGGPWTNNGVSSYDVAFSDDNGAHWYQFQCYPGILCAQSDDGTHMLGYIRAIHGKIYKMRVYDEGGNYADNSGSIGIYVYNADTGVSPWSSCADDYEITEIIKPINLSSKEIPGNIVEGIQLYKTLQAGRMYAIQITGGTWYDAPALSTPRYDAAISDDNGETWVPLEDYSEIDCAIYDGTTNYIRIYFVVPEDALYRLRVNDDDGWSDFILNTGALYYTLYDVGGPYAPDPTIPGDSSCLFSCTRPSPFSMAEILDLGNYLGSWADYSGCRIEKFFSWCQWHTQAIITLTNILKTREPFATFHDASEVFTFGQNEVDTYNWESARTAQFGDTVGGDPHSGVIDILPTLDETSPWMGGQIDLQPAMGGGGNSFECSLSLAYYMGGSQAAKGYCWFVNLLTSLDQVMDSIQLIFELGMAGFLIAYIYAWIKRVTP